MQRAAALAPDQELLIHLQVNIADLGQGVIRSTGRNEL